MKDRGRRAGDMRRSQTGRQREMKTSPPVTAAGSACREANRAADQAAADDTRQRLRKQGIIPVERDDAIAPIVGADEDVLAMRRSVGLERRHPPEEPDGGIGGDLYVTSSRLIHLGRAVISYDLDDVRDAVVIGGGLQIVIGRNVGIALRVDDPLVLRVEIAEARAARPG